MTPWWRRNTLVKWLWSAKPASSAMRASESSRRGDLRGRPFEPSRPCVARDGHAVLATKARARCAGCRPTDAAELLEARKPGTEASSSSRTVCSHAVRAPRAVPLPVRRSRSAPREPLERNAEHESLAASSPAILPPRYAAADASTRRSSRRSAPKSRAAVVVGGTNRRAPRSPLQANTLECAAPAGIDAKLPQSRVDLVRRKLLHTAPSRTTATYPRGGSITP